MFGKWLVKTVVEMFKQCYKAKKYVDGYVWNEQGSIWMKPQSKRDLQILRDNFK